MSDAQDIVERLRQERRPTAWTRGLDTDYPTAWEPNLLCHEAAAEIVRLKCLVEAVRGAFNRECDDADEILRALGLEPANCRTDGGSLKVQMLVGALWHRDVMLRRDARSAERERCAALCDEAKAAIWDLHEPAVKQAAQTVCENLAARIRGVEP